MKAGAGKAVIGIDHIQFPIENFYGIHDTLHARAILFQDTNSFLFISLELTSIRDYEIETLKVLASKLAGIKKQEIWICVTHTFTAPHTRSLQALSSGDEQLKQRNETLCKCIETAVLQAVQEAMLTLQEVTLSYALGHSEINGNRDVETADGWWLGYDEQGYSDHVLPVLVVSTKQGETLAILYALDMQSSVMDASTDDRGHQSISSDVSGRASLLLEESLGGVALFCVGAAGDQAPILQAVQKELDQHQRIVTWDHKANGYAIVESLAQRLVAHVLQAWNNRLNTDSELPLQSKRIQLSLPGQQFPQDRFQLHATKTYSYQLAQPQTTTIELMIVQGVAIVGVQPEITSHMGTMIREGSPFACTLVCTMVNRGAKYMAEQTYYEQMRYEAMNSSFAKGSGEMLCERIIQELQVIYDMRGDDVCK